jgi:CBS domain-containing protein
MTTIREIMTPDAHWLPQTATIAEAARLMRDQGIGFVPIANNDRLVGMVTDRDIVTRAVAEDLDAASDVKSIMSDKVLYCRDDADVDDVAQNMADVLVRRMPVVDADKRLVGVVSLGDIACRESAEVAGEALQDITAAP